MKVKKKSTKSRKSNSGSKSKSKFDLYEHVTSQIIAALEKGTIPWKRGWSLMDAPRNLNSNRPYGGINALLLGMADYKSPFWVTPDQAMGMGGNIEGAKTSIVVFWKMLRTRDEGELDEKIIPMLRYYRVFNFEQVKWPKDVKFPKHVREYLEGGKGNEFTPIEAAEKIVEEYESCPSIKHKGDRAFYRPSTDEIGMPRKEAFESPEEYYGTLYHELIHSTGHKSRLNRAEVGASSFGSEPYSREELVAEIGSAFLCGIAGIEKKIDNTAAYIQSWLKALKNDKKMVIIAGGRAQKATDFIVKSSDDAEDTNE